MRFIPEESRRYGLVGDCFQTLEKHVTGNDQLGPVDTDQAAREARSNSASSAN
jgi:hypothetical protein